MLPGTVVRRPATAIQRACPAGRSCIHGMRIHTRDHDAVSPEVTPSRTQSKHSRVSNRCARTRDVINLLVRMTRTQGLRRLLHIGDHRPYMSWVRLSSLGLSGDARAVRLSWHQGQQRLHYHRQRRQGLHWWIRRPNTFAPFQFCLLYTSDAADE